MENKDPLDGMEYVTCGECGNKYFRSPKSIDEPAVIKCPICCEWFPKFTVHECSKDRIKQLEAENEALRKELQNEYLKQTHLTRTFCGKEIKYWFELQSQLAEARDVIKEMMHLGGEWDDTDFKVYNKAKAWLEKNR